MRRTVRAPPTPLASAVKRREVLVRRCGRALRSLWACGAAHCVGSQSPLASTFIRVALPGHDPLCGRGATGRQYGGSHCRCARAHTSGRGGETRSLAQRVSDSDVILKCIALVFEIHVLRRLKTRGVSSDWVAPSRASGECASLSRSAHISRAGDSWSPSLGRMPPCGGCSEPCQVLCMKSSPTVSALCCHMRPGGHWARLSALPQR